MDKTTLDVHGVNRDFIWFDGWVVNTVNLDGNEDPNLSINVPFLVGSTSRYATTGLNLTKVVIQKKDGGADLNSQSTPWISHVPGETAQPEKTTVLQKAGVTPAGGVTWVKCPTIARSIQPIDV